MYSLAGGTLCYVAMIFMKKIVNEKQIWICSLIGALAHNIGQILMAILVTATPSLITYLPVLMISGIATGTFTGLCAQLAIGRFKHMLHRFHILPRFKEAGGRGNGHSQAKSGPEAPKDSRKGGQQDIRQDGQQDGQQDG
jgi:uncharacterized membrane protein